MALQLPGRINTRGGHLSILIMQIICTMMIVINRKMPSIAERTAGWAKRLLLPIGIWKHPARMENHRARFGVSAEIMFRFQPSGKRGSPQAS